MIKIQNDQAKVKIKAKKSKASKVIIDAKPDTDGVFRPSENQDSKKKFEVYDRDGGFLGDFEYETFTWTHSFETESAPGTATNTHGWRCNSAIYDEAGKAFFDGFAQGVSNATNTDKVSYKDILGVIDESLGKVHPTINIHVKNAGQVKKDIEELQKRLGESIDKSLDDQIRKHFGL